MKIALVSDTHLAMRAIEFAENFRAAAGWIDAAACDLVVHLGDITADGSSNSEEFDEALVLLGALKTPIRFVPGNHDVGDNPAGPGAKRSEEPPLDPDRVTEFRQKFGPDFWAFELEGWLLVGLNAQLFGTGTTLEDEQFGWLEQTLAHIERPVGLFLHKPLFRDHPSDTEVHVRYVPAVQRRRLLELFAGRDLRFVISGHAHQIRRIEVDGVAHIWLPATAFVVPDAVQERVGEKQVGIAVLDLSRDGFALEYMRPAGMADLDLLDHPHVYAQIVEIRQRLKGAA